MKFVSIIGIALPAIMVCGQEYPSCLNECVVGSCTPADNSEDCMCGTEIEACVTANCAGNDLTPAVSFLDEVCGNIPFLTYLSLLCLLAYRNRRGCQQPSSRSFNRRPDHPHYLYTRHSNNHVLCKSDGDGFYKWGKRHNDIYEIDFGNE
jgi:CFEM domain